MIICRTVQALQKTLTGLREDSSGRIGFVPTMGALHDGHLSLVAASGKENSATICSIFVNPRQFNNPDDFTHYPVTIEADIKKLEEASCDAVFLPSYPDIYPESYHPRHYDLKGLDQILEGAHRPGHFQGVCEVVDRLLDLVTPDTLYLGQKDFQQCKVIERLLHIRQAKQNPAVVIHPTLREADGLAMSSRNLRLTPAQRKVAPAIFQALNKIKQDQSPDKEKLIEEATTIMEESGFVVDYLEIVDADTLKPSPHSQTKVALAAATIGSVRLIDNMIL